MVKVGKGLSDRPGSPFSVLDMVGEVTSRDCKSVSLACTVADTHALLPLSSWKTLAVSDSTRPQAS